MNISEPNNGQRPFTAEPPAVPVLTHAQPKRKRHNAKLCPLAIRERIINALAAGDSKRAIARILRVSNNTVTAIAEQEWQQVEARKARIAAQAERAATSAFDRINNKLDSPDDIPLNILVPVAGVSVDKLIALRSEPSLVARIEHVHSGKIFQAYAELTRAISERAATVKAEQSSTAQLALPDGEARSGFQGLRPVRKRTKETPKNTSRAEQTNA